MAGQDGKMRGILFKPWKIKAIADSPLDREWQTRRVIKPQPKSALFWGCVGGKGFGFFDNEFNKYKPRYQVGEVVYEKEACWYPAEFDHSTIYYKSDWEDDKPAEMYNHNGKWRSPLFMPAWAARYFLTITDVRAERTRDITFADCLAEGIVHSEFWTNSPIADSIFNAWYNTEGCKVPIDDYIDAGWTAYARSVYFALYDSINGKDAHKTNWDGVYSFKRTED